MANSPNASTTLAASASSAGGGSENVLFFTPAASSADLVVRRFGTAQDAQAQHGYCPGVEAAALYVAGTGLSFSIVAAPIATPGAVSRFSNHQNTGTSVVTVAAGASGVLAEHDGVIRVVKGGTVGIDSIKLELSLDEGMTFQPLKLGKASSVALPNVNVIASFAAGTLVKGDTLCTWHGSDPLFTTGDYDNLRQAMADGVVVYRDVFLCTDFVDNTFAEAARAAAEAYDTSNGRAVMFRGSAPDRLPQASLSRSSARLTGAPSLTYDAAAATITRAAGSWLADGFQVGDTVTITGTGLNNVALVITALTATVLTTVTALTDETTSASTVVGSPTMTFDAAAATVTLNRGSWLTDGFRVGDSVTFAGTAANDFTGTATGVTDLVMSLTASDVLADDTDPTSAVTCSAGETIATWAARIDDEFDDIDTLTAKRVNIAAGRVRTSSPLSGWFRRVSAGLVTMIRSMQHDVHIAAWQRNLGSVGGTLEDVNGVLVEHDDRVAGGALTAGRFTCLTSSGSGGGVFVTLDLTRAGDGQLESLHSNMNVLDVLYTTVQNAGEQLLGRNVILNDDGTATSDSIEIFESEVNNAIGQALLADVKGEGPRCSGCIWRADPATLYNVAEPTMVGTADITLNGKIHSVRTTIAVNTGA